MGIRGQNEVEVAAKAAKAQINSSVVESFDSSAQARFWSSRACECEAQEQAIYNLGSLPSRAKELLAAQWVNDCPLVSETPETLKGWPLISFP